MKNKNIEKSQKLWEAADNENLALVVELLSDSEVDIDWFDENAEYPAVGVAALKADKDMVKFLLEHGANVPYLESINSDINEMFNIAALSYKIYGLDFLPQEDIEKLSFLENNLDLQELFTNIFEYHLTNSDNLPGKNENLAKYFGTITATYLNKLPLFLFHKISNIINNVEKLAIKEIKTLEAKLANHTNKNLEYFLNSDTAKEIVKNNPELSNILVALLNNQSLTYDIKTQIQEVYTLGMSSIVGEIT